MTKEQRALLEKCARMMGPRAKGHNLCWYVPELWDLLPDKVDVSPQCPPEGEFLEACRLYRRSLDVVPELRRVHRIMAIGLTAREYNDAVYAILDAFFGWAA